MVELTVWQIVFGLVLCAAMTLANDAKDPWLETQRGLYRGETVSTLNELAPYTGKAAADRIVGEDRAAAYLLNYEQLGINYGDNVEFQLRQELVVLCPQTEALLYGDFTPTKVRYQRGSRPELEQVVTRVTEGCATDFQRALAIMRFCRDLHKSASDRPFSQYVYGGTEEQMIAKPEILCETLSRLMVALCEVAGMPGRLVMHVLGGHITTEILADGQWAYIDPRCGMYFLKADGTPASVRELWRDPSIIRAQSEAVKAEVSDQWSWSPRAWKCENMYFEPREINGFQNYSLADAGRYRYGQLSHAQAEADGLMEINPRYVATARKALGLVPEGYRAQWGERPLRKIDIAYRHDGFSIFYKEPTMDRKELQERYIDPLAGTNASTLVWGLGPGSVFCYETKVGEIFGEGLSERERGLLREGDLWVHENVMALVKEGPGPLRVAVERSHELGIKILARLEMNHEYGPADPDNWMWVSLVGKLNKEHPEYRIGKSVLLDFKHKEVRDFKLAIFREALEAGVDGISADFAVYPPFFEVPDCEIMTGFVRELRALLDEFGERRGKRLEFMARVPAYGYMELGLDWKTWMREGLVDVIVPTHRRPSDYFDIRVEEFVDLGVETGVRVYPTVWQALGFVNTDQEPSDNATGRRRYDKPKTRGMYFAQALLFHRAGVDGIQLGFSEDQWRGNPWMNDLADPDKVLVADKHYMVDPVSMRPGSFHLERDGGQWRGEKALSLRIADDIPEARRRGHEAQARVVVYCRPLEASEQLAVYVNGNGPLVIRGDSEEEGARRGAAVVDPAKGEHETFIFDKDWWRRGEHSLAADAGWWRLGKNDIRVVYSCSGQIAEPPMSITWLDVILDYTP